LKQKQNNRQQIFFSLDRQKNTTREFFFSLL